MAGQLRNDTPRRHRAAFQKRHITLLRHRQPHVIRNDAHTDKRYAGACKRLRRKTRTPYRRRRPLAFLPSRSFSSGNAIMRSVVNRRPICNGGCQRPDKGKFGQVVFHARPCSSTTSSTSTMSPTCRCSLSAPANPANSSNPGSHGTPSHVGFASSQSRVRVTLVWPTPVSTTSTGSHDGPQKRAQQGAPLNFKFGLNSRQKGTRSRCSAKRTHGSSKVRCAITCKPQDKRSVPGGRTLFNRVPPPGTLRLSWGLSL